MLQGDLSTFDPMDPKPGLYLDMPEKLYRSAKAWNWSVLRYGTDTMSKVKWAVDNPEAEPDTDDKRLGRCFDILHLQPHNEEDLIAIQPAMYPSEQSKGRGDKKVIKIVDKPWNKNATVCRTWATEQAEKGREILRGKDLDRLKAMAGSLNRIDGVRELIEGAAIQPCIFWTDTQTGLMCKAKLDVYKNGIIGDDKKVAKSAAWEPFAGHLISYKMYCQFAMYLDGVNALLKVSGEKRPELQYVRVMVVEDHAPYDAAVYDLYDREGAGSRLWLQAGREMWHGILQQVAYCEKKGVWPGLNANNPEGRTEVEELEPPDWAVKRLEVGTP